MDRAAWASGATTSTSRRCRGRQRGLDRFAGPRPGADARAGANPKGFSVFQSNCTYVPNDIDAPAYTSPTIDDPCLDEGGLDQNIYGTRV